MAITGRPNKGVGHVERVDGGRREKDRLRLILQTITGEVSVNDACEQLGMGRVRFSELRGIALQGAVDALAPGRPGRPRKRDTEVDGQLASLEAEIERLRRDAKSAELRADLAVVMPELFDQKKGSRPKVGRRQRGHNKHDA